MGVLRQPATMRVQSEAEVFGDYKVLTEFDLPVERDFFVTALWGDVGARNPEQQLNGYSNNSIGGGDGNSGGGGAGGGASLNGSSLVDESLGGSSHTNNNNTLSNNSSGAGGDDCSALNGTTGTTTTANMANTMSSFYYEYLAVGLKDLNVEVGHWHSEPGGGGARTRKVSTLHPVKVSFPGMASHAPCTKTQTHRFVAVEGGGGGAEQMMLLVIDEHVKVTGIPYEDYFSVKTKWVVKQRPGGGRPAGVAGEGTAVHAKIGLLLTFHKSTWLQRAITSNTTDELKEAYAVWKKMAVIWLEKASAAAATAQVAIPSAVGVTATTTPTAIAAGGDGGEPMGIELGLMRAVGSTASSPAVGSSGTGGAMTDGWGSSIDEEVDEEFYDCQTFDAPSPNGAHHHYERGSLLLSSSDRGHGGGGGWNNLHRRSTRDSTEGGGGGGGDLEAGTGGDGGGGGGYGYDANGRPLSRLVSARTNMVNRMSAFVLTHNGSGPLLEVAAVMMEYVFFQVRGTFHSSKLKVLFDIEQEEVFRRLCCSLVPGMQGNVARKPDLYVPVMLALTLAQVFLFCMDVTQHHCRRETALGTSMAVSFGTWVGTSTFYYVVSFIMASRVRVVQSLAVTGYGLFGWCMGLMVCHAMTDAQFNFNFGDDIVGMNDENIIMDVGSAGNVTAGSGHVMESRGGLFNGLFNISAEVPLAFFGILSGASMGAVFWQQTPVRRGCMLLLHLPKLVCFLLVLGTHYQFLRYLHHQFLPGNQRLCAISSVLHAKDYYNIITQKELRQFVGA